MVLYRHVSLIKSCNKFSGFNSKVQLRNVMHSTVDRGSERSYEIPVAKGLPVVGTLFSFVWAGGGANLHRYIDGRHKELGGIFRETLGPVDGVFIADPQIMRKVYSLEGRHPVHILPESWVIYNEMYGSKRGLYFMDGEEWLNYRRILNKVFLTNYQNADYKVVQNEVVEDWIESWRPYLNKDIQIDETQFHRLSVSYVLATLIGDNYIRHKSDFKDSVDRLSKCVHTIFKESGKMNLLPAKLAVKLNLSAWRKFKAAVDSALFQGEAIVHQMAEVCSSDGVMKKLMEENVSKDMLTRIIVDLILAAGDTTSYTTQWSIYLLSRNKEVQEQLIKNPTDVSLLRGIVKETLRLYPAAPFITRVIPADLDGYHVKKNQMLIMSLYSSGRNEKYFPEPERFWPQRWERLAVDGSDANVQMCPANKMTGHTYRAVEEPNASQPFAMGIRSCVGKKMAESQLMMTLTKLASNFRLQSLEETEMTLDLIPVPKSAIRIRLLPI